MEQIYFSYKIKILIYKIKIFKKILTINKII